MGYRDGAAGTGLVDQQTLTVLINTAVTTTALDLGGHKFVAFLMPATMSSATFTFTASHDGTNFYAVHDDAGAAVSVTVTAAKWVSMSSTVMAKLAAFRYVKLVMAGNEAANRTIEVVLK